MNGRRLVAAAATAQWLALTACFSDRHGPMTPLDDVECTVPASAFEPGRALVLIRDFRFLPDTVRVPRGGSVTWVNCEPAAREGHTATAVQGAWGSATLAPGSRYEQRFDDVGTFDYLCTPHPHMRGTVIVSN